MALPTDQRSPDYSLSGNYNLQIAIIGGLFAFFGFATNLNDVLIPHLKRACQLSDFQSSFVQSAFFGAYFVMSLPAGMILRRTGYKKGIILGLLVAMLGALGFIPAAITRNYLFFLGSLSVLASGITILQVAANPYVSILGRADRAASRLNIMGVCNSLAGTLAPMIGGMLLLKGVDLTAAQMELLQPSELENYLLAEAAKVKVPYLMIAGLLALVAFSIAFLPLPEPPADNGQVGGSFKGALGNRSLRLGVLAIFFYVGAEVGVGSFMIRLADYLVGYSEEIGSRYASAYWFAAMIGRILGIFVVDIYISSKRILAVNAIAAILLVLTAIFLSNEVSLYLLVLVGACNSIMWPAIFPMGIRHLGIHTKQGSALMIQAVVGGALVPPLMGWISDEVNILAAYLVCAVCYGYILFYALKGHQENA